jgi:hypothetical protein
VSFGTGNQFSIDIIQVQEYVRIDRSGNIVTRLEDSHHYKISESHSLQPVQHARHCGTRRYVKCLVNQQQLASYCASLVGLFVPNVNPVGTFELSPR